MKRFTEYRIVETMEGKFAVQRRDGWRVLWMPRQYGSWGFLGHYDNYVWNTVDNIQRYCLLDTQQDANDSLNNILTKVREKDMIKSMPVIKKVIHYYK